MHMAIELSESEASKLREHAERLGVPPEKLATAAVIDLLQRDEEDFASAADYVLRKNAELYRRLARLC